MVGHTEGKLRDFYRIGKMLGSGKFSESDTPYRCLWRSQDVRSQGDWCAEGRQSAPQEPHGR
jgi:hypothetical protein